MDDNWFKVWFVLCAILGVALSAGAVYLLIEAAQWISRQ
jgi:hypothetical protein